MAYKQQPKSPVLKALVGDQHKLPKVLKDAILASPAKQTARPADPPKMSDAVRKEMAKKMSSAIAEAAPSVASTIKPSQKVMKEAAKKMIRGAQPASPAKQSAYKGGNRKTDAQMADRQRRVDGGLPVRRQDYAPGTEGQAAWKADRHASFENRRAFHKSVRTKLQSGEITPKEAQKMRNDFGKDWQKNASSKRTKADRNQGDAVTTFVVSRKGIKRKVSDAEKASYESVSGGKSPAKQTKKKRLDVKTTRTEMNKQLDVKRTRVDKGERSKSGPSTPRKMSQPKVKNKGPKQTLDGNVIKYSKNSPAKKKNPSSGFDGYTKIASSKNSNVIAAKKAAASRKNPKSTYKFTKDKKTGETHLYQKG
jgi:hypothetical protein